MSARLVRHASALYGLTEGEIEIMEEVKWK